MTTPVPGRRHFAHALHRHVFVVERTSKEHARRGIQQVLVGNASGLGNGLGGVTPPEEPLVPVRMLDTPNRK
jgi:hypothetical protein